MGIGSIQVELLQKVRAATSFGELGTVCELGSQVLIQGEVRRLLAESASAPGPLSARELYLALGFEDYVSIDFNGLHGALPYDLNQNLASANGFVKTFGLVTNFGTSEHCFNQHALFENIHNLCAVGGYMLHTLPSQGWGKHCFFRYDSNLFLDLAKSNNYEIIMLRPFLRLRPFVHGGKGKTKLYHLQTIVDFLSEAIDSRQKLRQGAAKLESGPVERAINAVGMGSALFNITLGCALRKTGAASFVTPIQGMYEARDR